MTPRVCVVAATHNRARRLDMLLRSLAEQTLPVAEFEVVIVDDASSDATPEVLAWHCEHAPFELRTARLELNSGPAAARNAGWREARAPLIAFTDDDCVAQPGWLEAGVAAAGAETLVLVQGPVEINPDELDRMSPFVHFMIHHTPGGGYPTANIFYPRALLEELGGFDPVKFPTVGPEDTDLACRAIERGARVEWAPEAGVFHGVLQVGALKPLRVAARWSPVVQLYGEHPHLRDELPLRVFWRRNHWLLFRFIVALCLPRRLGPVRLMLAAPYVAYLTNRRTGPLLAPYLMAIDTIEVLAILRGAIRYRVVLI